MNVAVEPVASISGRKPGQGQPTSGNVVRSEGKKAAMQDQRTPSGLQASYLVCQSDEKLAQLLHFLKVTSQGFHTPVLLHGCCCCLSSMPF